MTITITADAKELLDQASMTADTYLWHAIDNIDGRLGEGYAKQHPELIGAMMKAASADFHTAVLCSSANDVVELLKQLRDAHNASNDL